MAISAETYAFEGHGVLFQYADNPREWHVYCLENGSSGCGANLRSAVHEMVQTLAQQFKGTLSDGIDYFFTHPDIDREWLDAYKTGKHPDKEIRIKGNIRFTMLLATKNRSPRVERIYLTSGSSPAFADEFHHVPS